MSLIPIGFGGDTGGGPAPAYEIENSLRFRASASASLSRTPGVAGNQKTVTWSGWVKRGAVGVIGAIISTEQNASSRVFFAWQANDTLIVYQLTGGAVTINLVSASVYRDPSAWYHIALLVDTTQATASNRVRVYVNGGAVSLTGTQPALDLTTFFNAANPSYIGYAPAYWATRFDGYMAEIHFIDGQALGPDSFGEINPDTGVWVPKAYTGTYGTNGFYLPFNDGSNLTELCRDRSGNTNDWTATNVSLTAGVTYDWMDDTPTNNFAVLNPLIPISGASGGVLYDANLRAGANATAFSFTSYESTARFSSGKYYVEVQLNVINTQTNSNFGFRTGPSTSFLVRYNVNNDFLVNGSAVASHSGFTTNDIVGFAVDRDAQTIQVYRNNTLIRTQTGLNNDDWYAFCQMVRSISNSDMQSIWNFGQRPFAYTPPTGFQALCTKNLPAPAIARPDQHFKTYLYTGNGGALQVGEVKKKLEPYTVERSLRFRASASAYLSRTPGVAGNRRTWTWSGWVKRGTLSGDQTIFSAGAINSGAGTENWSGLIVLSSGALWFLSRTSTVQRVSLTTTSLLRDPSAWYHVAVAIDTTQATATNGVRFWVNGVLQSTTTANYTQNEDTWINSTSQHSTARNPSDGFGGAGWAYLDGYLSEINFIDGQALGPEEFGQTDGNGYWVPKAYTGTYGTNGFYLPFSDTTNTTTLCADSSGNGNDWTATNISLTAGETYDSMVDVPGNTYAVLNPLIDFTGFTAAGSPSAGNLNATASTSANDAQVSTVPFVLGGRYYFEHTFLSIPAGTSPHIGFRDYSANTLGSIYTAYRHDGFAYSNNTGAWSAYGASYAANDVIGVAFDSATGATEFFKNGVSQGVVQNAAAATAVVYAYIYNSSFNSAVFSTSATNFGQRPFAYTPPTGFLPLSENNIPEEENDMESPGLVWIKNRSASQNHALFDVAKGVQVYQSTNTTAAATTDVNSLIQFNRNGFYLGSSAAVNTANQNYVAWAWDTPATGTANTDGDTASTVWANNTAGVSIVTYAGTLTATGTRTIGHGLGVAPSMVITMSRSNTSEWVVMHKNLNSWAWHLYLHLTNAQTDSAAGLGGPRPAPTSTVFSTNYITGVNINGQQHIAYCFAEVPGFSRIGSYTGNGSTDGPFVYCGFRPRWILFKQSSAAGVNWVVLDAQRSDINVVDDVLLPSLPNAETSVASLDFTANGFKIRTSDAGVNQNAQTYIFLAFAESPFNFSRAR